MNNTRFAYLCVLLISLPFLAPFYRHGPLAFSLRSERPVRRFCGAVHESPRSQPRLPSRKSFRLPSHTSIHRNRSNFSKHPDLPVSHHDPFWSEGTKDRRIIGGFGMCEAPDVLVLSFLLMVRPLRQM